MLQEFELLFLHLVYFLVNFVRASVLQSLFKGQSDVPSIYFLNDFLIPGTLCHLIFHPYQHILLKKCTICIIGSFTLKDHTDKH